MQKYFLHYDDFKLCNQNVKLLKVFTVIMFIEDIKSVQGFTFNLCRFIYCCYQLTEQSKYIKRQNE